MSTAMLLSGRMAAVSLGARTAMAPKVAMRGFATTRAVPNAASATEKALGDVKKTASAAKSKAKAAPKKAKKSVEKLAAWQKRGEDGKLLPLPSATKPKRQSLYGIFMADRFESLRGDPSLLTKNKDGVDKFDVTKFSKRTAADWKALAEDQKQKFLQQKAQADKEYDAAMERWREALTPEDIRRQNSYNQMLRKKGKKASNLRDTSKPVRPLTAFFSFMGDLRKSDESYSKVPGTEFATLASQKFKELSTEARQKYEDVYQSAKQEYERQLREYKRNVGE